MNNQNAIGFLLNSLELRIFSPETQFIKAYESSDNNIYFVGEGTTDVYYHSDLKQKSFACSIERGSMFNEVSAIYGFR